MGGIHYGNMLVLFTQISSKLLLTDYICVLFPGLHFLDAFKSLNYCESNPLVTLFWSVSVYML